MSLSKISLNRPVNPLTWEAHFPELQESVNDSRDFLKRLTMIWVAQVFRSRNLLPSDAFRKYYADDIVFFGFNVNHKDGLRIAKQVLGLVESIDKGYLKQLFIVIREKGHGDVDDMYSASEVHTISFVYGKSAQIQLPGVKNSDGKPDPAPWRIPYRGYQSVRQAISRILSYVAQLGAVLKPLPRVRVSFQTTFFRNAAPPKYCPGNWYRIGKLHHFPKRPNQLSIDTVCTKHHRVDASVESVYMARPEATRRSMLKIAAEMSRREEGGSVKMGSQLMNETQLQLLKAKKIKSALVDENHERVYVDRRDNVLEEPGEHSDIDMSQNWLQNKKVWKTTEKVLENVDAEAAEDLFGDNDSESMIEQERLDAAREKRRLARLRMAVNEQEHNEQPDNVVIVGEQHQQPIHPIIASDVSSSPPHTVRSRVSSFSKKTTTSESVGTVRSQTPDSTLVDSQVSDLSGNESRNRMAELKTAPVRYSYGHDAARVDHEYSDDIVNNENITSEDDSSVTIPPRRVTENVTLQDIEKVNDWKVTEQSIPNDRSALEIEREDAEYKLFGNGRPKRRTFADRCRRRSRSQSKGRLPEGLEKSVKSTADEPAKKKEGKESGRATRRKSLRNKQNAGGFVIDDDGDDELTVTDPPPSPTAPEKMKKKEKKIVETEIIEKEEVVDMFDIDNDSQDDAIVTPSVPMKQTRGRGKKNVAPTAPVDTLPKTKKGRRAKKEIQKPVEVIEEPVSAFDDPEPIDQDEQEVTEQKVSASALLNRIPLIQEIDNTETPPRRGRSNHSSEISHIPKLPKKNAPARKVKARGKGEDKVEENQKEQSDHEETQKQTPKSPMLFSEVKSNISQELFAAPADAETEDLHNLKELVEANSDISFASSCTDPNVVKVLIDSTLDSSISEVPNHWMEEDKPTILLSSSSEESVVSRHKEFNVPEVERMEGSENSSQSVLSTQPADLYEQSRRAGDVQAVTDSPDVQQTTVAVVGTVSLDPPVVSQSSVVTKPRKIARTSMIDDCFDHAMERRAHKEAKRKAHRMSSQNSQPGSQGSAPSESSEKTKGGEVRVERVREDRVEREVVEPKKPRYARTDKIE